MVTFAGVGRAQPTVQGVVAQNVITALVLSVVDATGVLFA